MTLSKPCPVCERIVYPLPDHRVGETVLLCPDCGRELDRVPDAVPEDDDDDAA